MTEKEIRERVERFLKRTAEAVVVPATMGLGLSQVGCDHHTLGASPSDAGAEVQRSDTARNSDVPDPMLPYLVFQPADAADLIPSPEVLYGAAVPRDAGPDGTRDGGSDLESEAGRAIDTGEEAPRRMDLGPEVSMPPPPYLVLVPDPPQAPDARPDAPEARPDAPDARPDAPEARPDAADTGPDTAAVDALLPPPPPPYMTIVPPPPPPSPSKK
jgi:hypothetical protein